MKIIAFGYRRRTGKDLAAKLLLNILRLRGDKKVIKRSFATPLKAICKELFPFIPDNDDLKDVKIPIHNITPREIYIIIGEAAREVDPFVWINKTLNCKADILILTDVRKQLELDAIFEYDNLLIKMLRTVPQAAIEDELDVFSDWDILLTNDGSIKELHNKLENIANELI